MRDNEGRASSGAISGSGDEESFLRFEGRGTMSSVSGSDSELREVSSPSLRDRPSSSGGTISASLDGAMVVDSARISCDTKRQQFCGETFGRRTEIILIDKSHVI